MISGFYVFKANKKLFIGLWDNKYKEMLGSNARFGEGIYLNEIDEIICGPFQIDDLLTKFPKYKEKL